MERVCMVSLYADTRAEELKELNNYLTKGYVVDDYKIIKNAKIVIFFISKDC